MELVTTSTGPHDNLPATFRLYQNYPNPFNPSTEIRFDLPAASHVVVEVFNLLGRRVRSLGDTYLDSGSHCFEWDGTDDAGREVASGAYFYRVETDETVETKKMLLLK